MGEYCRAFFLARGMAPYCPMYRSIGPSLLLNEILNSKEMFINGWAPSRGLSILLELRELSFSGYIELRFLYKSRSDRMNPDLRSDSPPMDGRPRLI